MSSSLEKYKNTRCKLVIKENNESFGKVHFGVITDIDHNQKTITFSSGEKQHTIAFATISALRQI